MLKHAMVDMIITDFNYKTSVDHQKRLFYICALPSAVNLGPPEQLRGFQCSPFSLVLRVVS